MAVDYKARPRSLVVLDAVWLSVKDVQNMKLVEHVANLCKVNRGWNIRQDGGWFPPLWFGGIGVGLMQGCRGAGVQAHDNVLLAVVVVGVVFSLSGVHGFLVELSVILIRVIVPWGLLRGRSPRAFPNRRDWLCLKEIEVLL